MNRSIHSEQLPDCVSDLQVEIVERKGIGHPDSIIDGACEAVSIALSKYYLDNFDVIFHHNVDKGLLVGGKYRTKRFHVIRDDVFMEQIGAASKLNPSRDFIYELHAVGKKVADTWIQENFEKIGVSSSFDANEQVALRLARSGDLR